MANDLTIAASNCRVLQQEFACAHLNPREAGLCCEHLALRNCSNLVARMLSCLSGGHGMGSILCEVELKKKNSLGHPVWIWYQGKVLGSKDARCGRDHATQWVPIGLLNMDVSTIYPVRLQAIENWLKIIADFGVGLKGRSDKWQERELVTALWNLWCKKHPRKLCPVVKYLFIY